MGILPILADVLQKTEGGVTDQEEPVHLFETQGCVRFIWPEFLQVTAVAVQVGNTEIQWLVHE